MTKWWNNQTTKKKNNNNKEKKNKMTITIADIHENQAKRWRNFAMIVDQRQF